MSPNTSNKLYTQLTISSKSHIANKDTKIPALKKRRSSTSDKPNDVTIDSHKRSKILETCDIYNRNNVTNSIKVDNPVFVPENNVEKKCDSKNDNVITANGKSFSTNQVVMKALPFI